MADMAAGEEAEPLPETGGELPQRQVPFPIDLYI